MASVNWMKATTQKASAMKKHLGQTERENGNHANEHITRELSSQNYAIGCSGYAEALERMKARTKEVDAVLPPKRVRKDRVTCCFLELPCPRAITEQGKSDAFFQKAHEVYKNFFGDENVHGTFIHKDEVHEYTAKDGTSQMSCEHAHTLVSAFVEGKGINGKAFETRAKIKALNTAMDDMCIREYGMHLNTGETPMRKSVETLKQESEAKQELVELHKRVGELQQAEAESRDKFLEVDEKAKEAGLRAAIAEHKTKVAQNKLQEINAQYDVANNGLKRILDQKARASEIKRSIFDRDTQRYHINMLERTRQIGSDAYAALDTANKKLQKAVSVQQRAERKEQAIEKLYQQVNTARQQAEQERREAKKLREQQERIIEEKVEEKVNQIMQGTPTEERDRMRNYLDSLKFQDGSTALERFEEQERQLKKILMKRKEMGKE